MKSPPAPSLFFLNIRKRLFVGRISPIPPAGPLRHLTFPHRPKVVRIPVPSSPKTRSMSHAACTWSKNSPFYTVAILNVCTAKSFGKGDFPSIVFLDTTRNGQRKGSLGWLCFQACSPLPPPTLAEELAPHDQKIRRPVEDIYTLGIDKGIWVVGDIPPPARSMINAKREIRKAHGITNQEPI